METSPAGHPARMTDNSETPDPDERSDEDPKPPGPTDQGRTGGMATREVAPDVVEKHRRPSPVPKDATEVTEDQARQQDLQNHKDDDPQAPGRHQDRHQIADET